MAAPRVNHDGPASGAVIPASTVTADTRQRRDDDIVEPVCAAREPISVQIYVSRRGKGILTPETVRANRAQRPKWSVSVANSASLYRLCRGYVGVVTKS